MRIIKRLFIDHVENKLADDKNTRISYVWRFCILQRIGIGCPRRFPSKTCTAIASWLAPIFSTFSSLFLSHSLSLSHSYTFSILSIILVQRLFRCKLAQIKIKGNWSIPHSFLYIIQYTCSIVTCAHTFSIFDCYLRVESKYNSCRICCAAPGNVEQKLQNNR